MADNIFKEVEAVNTRMAVKAVNDFLTNPFKQPFRVEMTKNKVRRCWLVRAYYDENPKE